MKNSSLESFNSDTEKGLVLVDFWAPWCGPCKTLGPILEEVDKESSGSLVVVKVNADDAPQLLGQFEILGIPTMILFKDGQPVDKMVGLQSKSKILELINKYK